MASPKAAKAPASFLDNLAGSIMESASSIDAHIEAGALVDRILSDASPAGKRCLQALSELKDLARQDPAAVFATQGALPALLRVVSRLSPKGAGAAEPEEGDDEDGLEALQDALEALSMLVGEAPAESRAGQEKSRLDEAALRRGQEVAELVLRHTESGKQLLCLLSAKDLSTQFDAMVLLQRLYHRQPAPIQAALLADPLALNCLMQVLQSCHIDYVRNEALSFLLLITRSNEEIQKIVTVQGLVETVFQILEEEDLGLGGKVARDLLQCLGNLVGNATCQKYIRETGGFGLIVGAMATCLSGRRAGAHEGEEEEDEDQDQDDGRLDVPEEARWACLRLLIDASLALVGRKGPSTGDAGSQSQSEASANVDALIRAGAWGLCRHLSDAKVAVSAKLSVIELLAVLEPSALTPHMLEAEGANGSPPLLGGMATALMAAGTPVAMRSALGRLVGRAVARHASLQAFLVASLSPHLEQFAWDPAPEEPQAPPAGRQIVALLEEAANGRAEPQRLWSALHLVLAMLWGNTSVQSMLVSTRISFPGEDSPAETFLDLLLRVFSSCARTCLEAAKAEDAAEDAGDEPGQRYDEPAAALVASLKVLACWLSSCPAALVPFATSPVTVPRTMELTLLGLMCGPFFQVHVEGLAAFLMGICIRAKQDDVDVASLMALLAKRVGIEEFQHKVERLCRSQDLQRPPRALGEFRWYGSRFREFLRELQKGVQRRMVQLYVAEGVGGMGRGTMSEDIADQYKQLIRVQDDKFREVQKENESLRAEVEAFMRRSLQASSVALTERLGALQMENEALHAEVEELTVEVDEKTSRLEHEQKLSSQTIHDLEQQLHSIAVGYEQAEHASETLRQENTELTTSLAAARKMAAAPADESGRCAQLERDAWEMAAQVAQAQGRAAELEAERADLLDLLSRVAATSPDIARFVAPLGLVAGAPAGEPQAARPV